MAKKTFTDEEIAFLKENPYTAFVDRHTLSFTVAFKAEFMRLYKEGYRPSAIVEQLGYPIDDFIAVCPNCHAVLHRYRPWRVRETIMDILR